MKTAHRIRFSLETGLSSLCAVLFVVTLFRQDWIEEVSGFDPDQHDGVIEWAIVLTLLAVSVTTGVLARVEWRHYRLTRSQGG
jgi:hypothetical protein